MLHTIAKNKHGPLTESMAHAVESCVHCGFCLAACPTYSELGQEMDSPRGRIVLMKQVLEEKLPWADAQPHVDRCLGCLACEPACPSGVPYRDLISPFRAVAQPKFNRTFAEKLRRFLAAQTIPFPRRFRLAAAAGRLGKLVRPLIPAALRPMIDLVPASIPPAESWPRVTPAVGERRARVALLTGCAQQVLSPDINTATIAVLAQQGVEVIVPESQGCCGGLAWHTGDLTAAQNFARKNLAAFPADVDAILTNAAGCGSALHEYHLVLKGTPDEARAEAFRHRVMDVSLFLTKLGLRTPPPTAQVPRRIAYHDACHLRHAQQIASPPRKLLEMIPGLELVALPESEICCGAAGSYNLTQPEMAGQLGDRKADRILQTKAQAVFMGNVGCLLQVARHLRKADSNVWVAHTIDALWASYSGEMPAELKKK